VNVHGQVLPVVVYLGPHAQLAYRFAYTSDALTHIIQDLKKTQVLKVDVQDRVHAT
jgi:hypothetical protein